MTDARVERGRRVRRSIVKDAPPLVSAGKSAEGQCGNRPCRVAIAIRRRTPYTIRRGRWRRARKYQAPPQPAAGQVDPALRLPLFLPARAATLRGLPVFGRRWDQTVRYRTDA